MKKYVAIITEDNGDYQFDHLCDNPWDGNFRDVVYGDNAEEIVSDGCNGDYEGLFYQLYETGKGKRIGYSVFNYEEIHNDINEYTSTNGTIIDGNLYMVKTVSELAAYAVRDLDYDGTGDLVTNNQKFINCDFCLINEDIRTTPLEDIIHGASSWHGIRAIDTGFETCDLDIATDYYGGGCLRTISLECSMTEKECRNLVTEILLESLSDKYCTCADTDLLLVEVKGDDINEK